MDIDKAFEAQNGFTVETDDDTGAFYTGGSASPVGLDLPTRTIYVQTNPSSKVLIWQKFNTGVNDWRQLSAEDIPFNDTGLDITAANVQGAIETQVNRHYGKDFDFQIKTASETTTGNAFNVYDTLTFNVSDASGINRYRLAWNYFWGHNSAANDIRAQHMLDNNNIFEMRKEPKDSGGDQRIDGSFVHYADNLSNGSHSIAIQYRPATSSRTSRMYRSVLEVWRVG